jgi:hypothetical protein
MGWRELFGLTRPGERAHGRPPSGNGASSFHLFWELPPHQPLREVSATFELLDEPARNELYFWALQTGFADAHGGHGGAHFGFQWNPPYPDKRAVCWGGYANVGGELDGGPTSFPSIDGNRNVCGYPWTTRQRWTWRIRLLNEGESHAPTGQRAWRAELDDPNTGETVAIRDLWCRGDRLVDPMVWSEVFAPCDDPIVRVRWSDFRARTDSGVLVAPTAVSVNYQSHADGGCSNTDASVDGYGIVQSTSTERLTAQGTRLAP